MSKQHLLLPDAAEDKVFAFGVDSTTTGTCYTVLQRDCLGYWDCSNPNGNAYYYRGEHLPGPPEPPPSPPASPSPPPPPDDCVNFEFFEFTGDPGATGGGGLAQGNAPYVSPGGGTHGRNVDVRQCALTVPRPPSATALPFSTRTQTPAQALPALQEPDTQC